MYNLSHVPDDNLGGVAALYYTDQSDVLTVPEETDLVLQGDITLKPGAVWYKLEATFNTRSFKEDPKTSRHGVIFNQQLKGFKPKDSATLAHALNDLRHRRLAYLYRDQNGIMRFVPNAEFLASFDTETVGGRNGYEFNLRSESLQPALYYAGEVPIYGLVVPRVPSVLNLAATPQSDTEILLTWINPA